MKVCRFKAFGIILSVCLGLFITGVVYLCHLNYIEINRGILINVREGSDNNLIEVFEYGDKGETCLISRGKIKGDLDEAINSRYLGSKRKIWLHKPNHCTDRALRNQLTLIGVIFITPFIIIILGSLGVLYYSWKVKKLNIFCCPGASVDDPSKSQVPAPQPDTPMPPQAYAPIPPQDYAPAYVPVPNQTYGTLPPQAYAPNLQPYPVDSKCYTTIPQANVAYPQNFAIIEPSISYPLDSNQIEIATINKPNQSNV